MHVLSLRRSADAQIRSRFGDVVCLVKIPKLYALSAIGKRLCYYTFDDATETIRPTYIADSTIDLKSAAPIDRWDSNVMEPEDHDRFPVAVKKFRLWSIIAHGVPLLLDVLPPDVPDYTLLGCDTQLHYFCLCATLDFG